MKQLIKRGVLPLLILSLLFSISACANQTPTDSTTETLPYVNELFCELSRK